MKWPVLFIILLSLQGYAQKGTAIYKTKTGTVKFHSEAPLESIKASSGQLNGLLNIENRNFAFAVAIESFEGFNIALQKDHFNENYLESDKFPVATFAGKIIEDIDSNNTNAFDVRAKGILKIHGVEVERIIKVTLKIKGSIITANSKFTVLLIDHDIKIPKIVHEKIASEISVDIHAELIK